MIFCSLSLFHTHTHIHKETYSTKEKKFVFNYIFRLSNFFASFFIFLNIYFSFCCWLSANRKSVRRTKFESLNGYFEPSAIQNIHVRHYNLRRIKQYKNRLNAVKRKMMSLIIMIRNKIRFNEQLTELSIWNWGKFALSFVQLNLLNYSSICKTCWQNGYCMRCIINSVIPSIHPKQIVYKHWNNIEPFECNV